MFGANYFAEAYFGKSSEPAHISATGSADGGGTSSTTAGPTVKATGTSDGGGAATGTATVHTPVQAIGTADGGGTATGTASASTPIVRTQSGQGKLRGKKPPARKRQHHLALANADLGALEARSKGKVNRYGIARTSFPDMDIRAHATRTPAPTTTLRANAHATITFSILQDDAEVLLLSL